LTPYARLTISDPDKRELLIPKKFTTQPNPYAANLANYEPNPDNPSSYVLKVHAFWILLPHTEL
jgi:hypothetical protein